MPIGDSPCPDKISCCTPDPLTYAMSFFSQNYVITLTTPCDSSNVTIQTYDATSTDHIMIRDKHDGGNLKRGTVVGAMME